MGDSNPDRDEVQKPPIASLADMRANAERALGASAHSLSEARKHRDEMNGKIAALVTEVADLRRVVAAMTRTPRTRKTKG